MCPILVLRSYQMQKHAVAASCFAKLELRRDVPEQRVRTAPSLCSKMFMLLAVSVLVSFTSGTLAQVQEIIPPILSNGLRAATAPPTPVIDKPKQTSTTQSLFDATSLPPIESVDAGSDIQAFLAPGVPQDLARPALRRAWLTDPAIRDFIGLSENSWDFNALDGIPGFGSLMTDDAGRLLAGVAEESATSMLSGSDQRATGLNKSAR